VNNVEKIALFFVISLGTFLGICSVLWIPAFIIFAILTFVWTILLNIISASQEPMVIAPMLLSALTMFMVYTTLLLKLLSGWWFPK